MRIKIFAIIFLGFTVILLGSAFLIFSETQTIKGLGLGVLEGKLYTENTKILEWSMKSIDPSKLGQLIPPPSWGEIMIVDNETLNVKASTISGHVNMSFTKIPELLDQAVPVLEALKNARQDTVETKDYMIVLSPYVPGNTLIGFKPRSWEKGLVSEQNTQIQKSAESATKILVFYLAGGFLFAFVISLAIAFLVTVPIINVAKAFEKLSLGDFDQDLPASGGKVFTSLSDSFFRIKTSLRYALDKLGSR